MTTPHASDSLAQRDAEALIIAAVAEYVGEPLAASKISLGDGVRVEIDGASEDHSILVEAYAHIGKLVGAQPKKLATDAFKLTWAGGKLGSTRLIIAVIDPQVEAYLMRPTAWLTASLRDSSVEVVRVSIHDDAHARVAAAQKMQFMTGDSGAAS